MTSTEKLKRAIQRSEMAYSFYLKEKLYYQALRIYNANIIVHSLLEELIYDCEEDKLDQVFKYLFHLEDWFTSFELSEKNKPALDESFVFSRFEDSPPFPVDFIKNVLNS